MHLSSILKGFLLRIVPLACYGLGPFIIPLVVFEGLQPGSLSGLDLVRSFNSAFFPSLQSLGLWYHCTVSSE